MHTTLCYVQQHVTANTPGLTNTRKRTKRTHANTHRLPRVIRQPQLVCRGPKHASRVHGFLGVLNLTRMEAAAQLQRRSTAPNHTRTPGTKSARCVPRVRVLSAVRNALSNVHGKLAATLTRQAAKRCTARIKAVHKQYTPTGSTTGS